MIPSKKNLCISMLALVMQSSIFAVIDTASNVVFDWDARIQAAQNLKGTARADYCNNKFGFHGRLLRNYLNENQKQKVFALCGKAMQDKNPQAYAALQEAQTPETTKTKSSLGKKSQELASEAEANYNLARQIKEREKAKYEEFQKLPWYKQLVS